MKRITASQWEESYRCEHTGYTQPIIRREGRRRKMGHRKWLFCLKCYKKHNFINI